MTSGYALPFGKSGLTCVFLISLRLAAVFMMTPLLYAISMPTVVRMLLVLGLSVALSAGLQPSAIPSSDIGALLLAAAIEISLGMTLALGILLAFGAFAVAGNLLDVQIGFGIAQVFDPVSNRQLPRLTSAFNQVAVLVFFLIDGHHALLRGIAYSLERFPLGMPWSLTAAAAPLLKQVTGLFSLGFALAAPVVFCILLVDLALGVVARNLPQMNMFAMGIPVKIVAGLAALSLWYTGIGGVMNRVSASIYATWDQVFMVSDAAVRGAH